MTEIAHWRCLVRMWLANGEPDYNVMADGHWLVFDVSLSVLYELYMESSIWRAEEHSGGDSFALSYLR